MDDAYGRIGHRLAEVLVEQEQCREWLAALAHEHEQLERHLAEFMRHEWHAAEVAEQRQEQAEQARVLELAETVRFRVPEYLAVGEATRRIETSTLSILSQRIECPPGCTVAALNHRHFADGQIAYY